MDINQDLHNPMEYDQNNKYMELHIISGYNEETVYGEDSNTVVQSSGLQMEERTMEVDWVLFDFIEKTNGRIRYAFARLGVKRNQEVDRLVLGNIHSSILEYYPWLIDYMSYTGLKKLKEHKDLGTQYQEPIDVAMQKVRRENLERNFIPTMLNKS